MSPYTLKFLEVAVVALHSDHLLAITRTGDRVIRPEGPSANPPHRDELAETDAEDDNEDESSKT
ncbi:unnamed protein product [Acanthoscelides obtectus]|uniref:Uncharacterized protein n=1 Tax=Acanthoscelides obtectus TaxID=200917 RepID=A0A9P0PDB1_ACAOB|nr:unnamed protein product [Acanthoscelides obtectus]CAK1625177.1 hypothetical protein AOBTE_LOCUS3010 [Acanthoscelides obtectus]